MGRKLTDSKKRLFVQLRLSGFALGEALALVRNREQKYSDNNAALNLWNTPECQKLKMQMQIEGFESLAGKPLREVAEQISARVRHLRKFAERLKHETIRKENLVAFWEDVQAVGAHQVLDSISKGETKWAHLVEHYKKTTKTTTDREGNVTTTITEEVKLPSKETATKFIVTFKNFAGTDTSANSAAALQRLREAQSRFIEERPRLALR